MYGKKLKMIRKHFATTQEGMAEFLGITPRTYSSYERDENNPPYSMLVLLCKNHDVNLNWFIADVGDIFNPPNFAETWKEINENIENYKNITQQDKQLEDLVARLVDKRMKEKGL